MASPATTRILNKLAYHFTKPVPGDRCMHASIRLGWEGINGEKYNVKRQATQFWSKLVTNTAISTLKPCYLLLQYRLCLRVCPEQPLSTPRCIPTWTNRRYRNIITSTRTNLEKCKKRSLLAPQKAKLRQNQAKWKPDRPTSGDSMAHRKGSLFSSSPLIPSSFPDFAHIM